MQKYTKAIIAFAGVLLPFLEQLGVALPEFLTLDWVQTIVLALTPIAVFFFPNRDAGGLNLSTLRSPAIVGVLALMLTVMALGGCESLGVPRAESFNDRAGYALGTHSAVLQTITTGVSQGELSSDEANGAAAIADRARDLIDTARRFYSIGDQAGANRQLSLAITILQELQAHLRGDPT